MQPQQPQQPPQIVLTITLDTRTGHVNVNGPVANKLLCYGMLELARDAIRDFKPEQAPKIVLPEVVLGPAGR